MTSPLVTVRTPAPLAGLGAVSSCLGMALDSWSTLEAWPAREGGCASHDAERLRVAHGAMEALWQDTGAAHMPVRVGLRSDSSPGATVGGREGAIVGGLVAANEMAGRPLPQSGLLRLGVSQGGRVDGLAAALLGGLQLATSWEGRVATAAIPVPLGLTAVLFLVESPMERGMPLGYAPTAQPDTDAWRVALLVNALASSRMEGLASQEPMQPSWLYPDCAPMRLTCAGAMVGGALAVFPAAGGAVLVALTRGKEMTVAYEMAEAARQAGLPGSIKITKPSGRGAHVIWSSRASQSGGPAPRA